MRFGKGVAIAVQAGFLALFLLVMVVSVMAAPAGPETTSIKGQGSHVNGTFVTSGVTVPAQAGNVTELILSQTRSTQSWQGYTGNVTGTIVLDDGNNNTLYDWNLNSPTGEVYASNGTPVNWAAVYCINFTSNASDGHAYNLSSLNYGFGINESDLDDFSRTFNTTLNATFMVGGVRFAANSSCRTVHTFVDQAYQNSSFQEVLLTDNTSVIFTTLLENNLDGYRIGTDTWDFQMMVAENGHPGFETSTTNYYFFLELS